MTIGKKSKTDRCLEYDAPTEFKSAQAKKGSVNPFKSNEYNNEQKSLWLAYVKWIVKQFFKYWSHKNYYNLLSDNKNQLFLT